MERESIESLVRRFREQLEAGERPMIEEIMGQIDHSQRLLLLVLLIQNELEFAYLRSTREIVDSVDENDHRVLPRVELYLKRFPELVDSLQSCKEIVSMEFALHYAGSTQLTIDHYLELLPQHADAIKPMLKKLEDRLNRTSFPPDRFEPISSHESTVPDSTSEPLKQWKLPKVLGYFHLLSLIGNGGMGSVFRALDLRTGAVCAIKVMRRADSWSVYRFNEEFQVLASLDHPNLGSLYESFYDGFNRYFSMELIAGPSLNRWWQLLPKEGPFLEKLQRCLQDVAVGIQFLHENGIVHGDIKPSNIVVSRRGRAVILDFGLSRILGDQQPAEAAVKDRALVGTIGYTAPELAQGHPTSFTSDWFAFGCILRDLLQTSPWKDEDSDREPNLVQAWNEYRELLDSLRQRLVMTDPNARDTGDDVLRTLCHSISPTQLGWYHHFHSPYVGRAELRDALTQFAAESFASRRGRFGVVHGPLGIGKTRLLQECRRLFATELQAVPLWIRGLRQDGSPFQLVNSIIQAFVNHFLWNPRDCLADENESLRKIAEAFPQLHQILDAKVQVGLEKQTTSAAQWQECSRLFFESLCRISRRQRFALLIDDVQHYDRLDQTGLCGLWNSTEANCQCVVLASCVDYVPGAHSVRGLESQSDRVALELDKHAHQRWSLGPMDDAELTELAMPILKALGLSEDYGTESRTTLMATIAKTARGVPQTLFDILQMLAERGGAQANWTQWVSEIGELDIAHVRFGRLTRESQQILELLAIAIEPVTFRQLQVASRVGPEVLFPHVGSLVRRGWLRWSGTWPDLLIEPFGNASAKQILGWIDVDRQKRRHARLAKAMTNDLHPPWMTIGRHYQLAGKTRRAIAAFMQAAAQFEKSGEHALRDEALRLARSLGG